jgi:dienelactone hydrolase
VQTVEAFGDKVNAAGGVAEVFVYPACGHAFLNSLQDEEAIAKRALMGFPEPTREAQELAWRRTFALFEQHLQR